MNSENTENPFPTESNDSDSGTDNSSVESQPSITPPVDQAADQAPLSANEEEIILDDLKNRATSMGVKFHPSIGIDKLRIKIQEALDAPDDQAAQAPAVPKPAKNAAAQPTDIRTKALQLIRVRVTNMDPAKSAYKGEIITTGNSQIGTVKKYVAYDVPYHVPRIIYNVLRARKFQTFTNKKLPNGFSKKEGKLVNTYAIEELPPLNEKELTELKQRQIMAFGQAA